MFADRVIGSPQELTSPRASRHWMRRRLHRLGHVLADLVRNHVTRRYLREMDDRMLSDIGISRAQARLEASRWMWDSRPY